MHLSTESVIPRRSSDVNTLLVIDFPPLICIQPLNGDPFCRREIGKWSIFLVYLLPYPINPDNNTNNNDFKPEAVGQIGFLFHDRLMLAF